MDDETTADDVARVLTGLGEYTVLEAMETPEGLVVEVIATRAEAPCPGCGTFSGRVKSYRTSTEVCLTLRDRIGWDSDRMLGLPAGLWW